jgi:mannose-6-phosphate isomerase-like protein (cupin superfamily)
METGAHQLALHPLHLGPDGRAVVLPAFTGPEWYAAYEAAHGADGAQGRLVSLHHCSADWNTWEMHPAGDEVVICLTGQVTLIQQDEEGRERRIPLAPGEHAINPPGVWHTADVAGPASLLFITVGAGTQGRPR